MPGTARRVIILGSTGSIGVQTLDVIDHLNGLHARGLFDVRHEVVGLAAGKRADLLAEQRRRCGAPRVALADGRDDGLGVLGGPGAAERLVRETDAELIVAAMVGFSGLPATFEAIRLGRDVALANKETLVAAGELVVAEAARSGSRILPVDSEHAALWQCLQLDGGRVRGVSLCPPCAPPPMLTRAVLTASGGPFRTSPLEEVHRATPEQALRHPTWRMGPKITVDSATLMNKTLEVIEAHWLFGLPTDRMTVLIHPQSQVHAMAEFADGSTVAHLAHPDMRGPIQQALSFPRRVEGCIRPIGLDALTSLNFEPPDPARFPALSLASRVIAAGGTSGAVLNAANEACVSAFLAGKLPFGRIVELASEVMDRIATEPLQTLDDARRADEQSRALTRRLINL
jgi:1-deoxy-D-xylulose-5-phosphate reductoisomerase